MFHKIKSVEAEEKFLLKVLFEDGTIKRYDVKLLKDKWSIFATLLKENELFKKVKVDDGGYGVSWNDELDLSCDELWENGV